MLLVIPAGSPDQGIINTARRPLRASVGLNPLGERGGPHPAIRELSKKKKNKNKNKDKNKNKGREERPAWLGSRSLARQLQLASRRSLRSLRSLRDEVDPRSCAPCPQIMRISSTRKTRTKRVKGAQANSKQRAEIANGKQQTAS